MLVLIQAQAANGGHTTTTTSMYGQGQFSGYQPNVPAAPAGTYAGAQNPVYAAQTPYSSASQQPQPNSSTSKP